MTQKLSRRKRASELLDAAPPAPAPEDIEIVDDAPPEGGAVVQIEAGAEPEETVESLREQLAREREEKRQLLASKTTAEHAATSYRREADGAAAEALNAARAAVENGLHLTQSNIAAAQRAIADSAAAGDWMLFSEAQKNLSENLAKQTELNAAKAEIEYRAKNPAPRQPVGDPVEAQIAQFTPQSQAWLRKNRDAVFKDEKSQILTRKGHEMAVEGMGLIPDSPEYFAFMDDHINRTMRGAPPPPASKAPARVPAAPVSPAAFGQAPTRKGQISLTAEQKQAAIETRPDLSPQQAILVYAQGVDTINDGTGTNLRWSAAKYQGGRT